MYSTLQSSPGFYQVLDCYKICFSFIKISVANGLTSKTQYSTVIPKRRSSRLASNATASNATASNATASNAAASSTANAFLRSEPIEKTKCLSHRTNNFKSLCCYVFIKSTLLFCLILLSRLLA